MIGRLSIATARLGRRDEVLRLYRELGEALRSYAGHVAGFVFSDPGRPR